MVYLKIYHLKHQLWTVITWLLSVLLLADPFYSIDFNTFLKEQFYTNTRFIFAQILRANLRTFPASAKDQKSQIFNL